MNADYYRPETEWFPSVLICASTPCLSCSHNFGNYQQHPWDSTAFAEQAAAEMIMSNQHAVLSFPCLMILTLGEAV